jgi:hypothetical protein
MYNKFRSKKVELNYKKFDNLAKGSAIFEVEKNIF